MASLPTGWNPTANLQGIGGSRLLSDMGYAKYRPTSETGSFIRDTQPLNAEQTATNAATDQRFAQTYGSGTTTGQRELGGGKYEVGLFDASGKLVSSKVYDHSNTFIDKLGNVVEVAAPLALAAMVGAGLSGVGTGAGAGAAVPGPAVGNGAFLGEGLSAGAGGLDAAAAAGGGAGAAGAGSVGGSGLTLGGTGGAVGGTGLAATPGAGLSLAAPTGTGAGLSAAAGEGLTLAGATGTGAGLSAGTGAGVIGSGIGASIPTGAVVAPAAGAATSSLPSWLTSGMKDIGTRTLVGAGLGALAGGAALGSGNVSTAGQQSVANTLAGLGTDQAAIAKEQYQTGKDRIAANDPLFTQIIEAALNQQQQQGQRSDQLWQSYLQNFLPAAEQFAQKAQTYDTAGRRDEAGAAARAAVETEAAMQRESQQRALGRAGVSISSGKSLALDNASRLNQTKLSTGAAADARQKVENTGLTLLGQTANIGQGIVGTSQQQAGQALTAGSTASGTLGAKEGARNASLAPAQAFYGGATSATGAAGNVLNGIANTEASNRAANNAGLAGLGSLAGTLLTAGKDSVIGNLLSDPEAKTVNGPVDGARALADLESKPVMDWTYKPGMGDGGRHIGRMADEEDPMNQGGMHGIDVISELGKQHAAIVELAKEVKALTGRRSLADMEAA